MNPEIKKLWTDALRSGEFKQDTDSLRNDGFCCLGVLCELHRRLFDEEWQMRAGGVYQYLGESAVLPSGVIAWAGLPALDFNPVVDDSQLSAHNDGIQDEDNPEDEAGNTNWVVKPKSFSEIADLIERNL